MIIGNGNHDKLLRQDIFTALKDITMSAARQAKPFRLKAFIRLAVHRENFHFPLEKVPLSLYNI
jgi:hypothetical protein